MPALPRLLSLLAALSALAWVSPARAQSTIKMEGKRSHYSMELEPHLLFGWNDPPGVGTGDGFGLGLRGTFEVAPNGFIRGINDSVGVGVGLDWVHYNGNGSGPRGKCVQFVPLRDGTEVCVQATGSGDDDTNYLWIPVVMQWNFWLHQRWSVFGEPGLALHIDDSGGLGLSPVIFFIGGRFHLSYNATLTLRLSPPYAPVGPYASFGASFLF